MRSTQGPPRAFTLIELLVVLAVIALLLAILVPALNQAKRIARQLVCGSHMKQWAMAVHLYASDNDGYIPPYADVRNVDENALDYDTYWYNRLITYLTEPKNATSLRRWGFYDFRKCPTGKGLWGEEAVWIGVYFGRHDTDISPFVFVDWLRNGQITRQCNPVKTDSIRNPGDFLMMLDVQRDHVFNPFQYPWRFDVDGDGRNDSHNEDNYKWKYNFSQPKAHRNGCNVALFDGHTEKVLYRDFWEIGEDGFPVHRYWYNQRSLIEEVASGESLVQWNISSDSTSP